MLGLFPGGNKTRKLEFLVADALAQGADTLITCGAVQSNHCRLTLAAAAMQRCASALAGEGRKGYVIPGGGSNALGGLGYVACAQEILAQSFDSSVPFEAIVAGSGSSGTHGGLVAGLFGANAGLPVIGIGVSRDPEQQEPLVHAEALATAGLLGLHAEVPRAAVRCVGGYWQPKYSLPNRRMVEAVQLLARLEAVPLDPTYTGKAMAGLIGLVRAGEFSRGDNVLFIHTSGLPSLFSSTGVVLGRAPVDAD